MTVTGSIDVFLLFTENINTQYLCYVIMGSTLIFNSCMRVCVGGDIYFLFNIWKLTVIFELFNINFSELCWCKINTTRNIFVCFYFHKTAV